MAEASPETEQGAAPPLADDTYRGPPRRRGAVFAIIMAVVALVAIAFAAGLLLSPWFEAQVRPLLPPEFQSTQQDDTRLAQQRMAERMSVAERRITELALTPPTIAPVSGAPKDMDSLRQQLENLEESVARLADSDAGLSARISQTDLSVKSLQDAAAGTNSQARDLLLVGAARRFVESGRPLGTLVTLLGNQFGAVDAAAIESLNMWSQSPNTMAQLRADLDELASPREVQTVAPQGNWWERLSARLSRLVSVRDGSEVEEEPATLARDALNAGHLPLAIAQIERSAPSAGRDAWLVDARRLQGAYEALDRLEGRIFATVANLPATPPPTQQGKDVQPPVNAPQ